jgi:hypothetical protein
MECRLDLFLLRQIPVVGCFRDPQGLTDLPDRQLLVPGKSLQLFALLSSQHLGSAKQPTPGSSGHKARVRALFNEIPLKLCQRVKDMEDQLAA